MRIASTTSSGVPTTGAAGSMTLSALMARQKAAAEASAAAMEPQQIQSPLQGLAQMARAFVAARQGAYAEDQATQGRAKLAELLSGVNPETGADPATAAQIYALDPDAGGRVMEAAAAAIRAKREREQKLADVADTRKYESGQEAAIDTRELGQTVEAEKRKAAADLAAATGTEGRAAVAAEAERAATPDTALGKLQADLKEGRIDQATYDAAVAKEIAPTGSGVTINTGDTSNVLRKKFGEKEGERWDSYLAAGDKAAALTADMQLLDELAKMAPQGPILGPIQQQFPGISSAGAAFQSVVKRLAPQMRAVGSGSTSDIEYNGMLESLPRLGNYPEANALISGMMKAKAQMDIQRADLITKWANGDINDSAARTALSALNRQSIMTPELRNLIAATAPEPGTQGVPAGGGLTDMTDEELDAEIARRAAEGGGQ